VGGARSLNGGKKDELSNNSGSVVRLGFFRIVYSHVKMVE
jgi:hypothetical protein